jgi:chorismate dehydratase
MRIRLGQIDFMNALPFCLDDVLPELEIQSMAPLDLNHAMRSGLLDISPVSTACYLQNPERFTVLSDLSISATAAVESVLLFWPLHKAPARIAIPNTSETSIALMNAILISQKRGLSLPQERYARHTGKHHLISGDAVLAIGDEALLLKHDPVSASFEKMDLAEVWVTQTGLPFVFALWVVQHSFALAHPQETKQVHQALLGLKARFYEDQIYQERVIDQAVRRMPQFSVETVRQYLLQSLSYDYTPQHQESLEKFKQILHQQRHSLAL